MSPRRVDVVVAGGGPAGSAAAITLARAGRRVLLADRARFPRDKCCGDGLTTGALRRLEGLGLAPEAVASFTPAVELDLVSPSGRRERFPLVKGPGLFAAVARRWDLDAALLERARAAGAVVEEEAPVEAVAPVGDELSIGLGGDTLRAGALLAADGAWSPVRKLLGPAVDEERAGGPGEWHAFRAYATGVRPAALGSLGVAFDEELLPGYAWSFPFADGSANVGICLQRPPGTPGRELRAAWLDALGRRGLRALLGPKARVEGAVRTWPIPSGVVLDRLGGLGGRVLFAGDAARAADPFTGEGIAQALLTGSAAAAALAAAPGRPAQALAAYTASVRRTLGREHRLAAALSAAMARPLAARGAVALGGLGTQLPGLVGRWLFEGFPRLVVLEPGAWRPGAFSPPGAYVEQRWG